MKLLILSDIHANLPALEAVLRAEPDHDEVVCCGDMVDYGPNPVECVRWVAGHAGHRVRGNHDNAMAFGVDCRCMGPFHTCSVATCTWQRNLLGLSDIEYLRRMPTQDWFEWQGRHFRMAHATPQGDLFEYLTMDRWGEHVAGVEEEFVLLGHTHVQGMRSFGKATVVNPGSVGLSRDVGGEACYAVYDGERMELKRVPYDVDRTIADLRSAPLPGDVAEALTAVLTTGRLPPSGPVSLKDKRV
jgi:putative phosphoesterase